MLSTILILMFYSPEVVFVDLGLVIELTRIGRSPSVGLFVSRENVRF